MEILGIRFEKQTVEEYQAVLRHFLKSGKGRMVVTPNPEMLVEARRSPALRDVLNRADLRLVDGVGIVVAGRIVRETLHRYTGVDALYFLARECSESGLKMLLAGGLHADDADRAMEAFLELFPNLDICAHGGGLITLQGGLWVGDDALKQAIMKERPDVLALGLGHGKQELWLSDHLDQFPFLRLAIGVGGAIEFYSGRQVRAPN